MDPRLNDVKYRHAKRRPSPLIVAIEQSLTGEKVNFCPLGCEIAHLDMVGYCRHLIGFTNAKFGPKDLLPGETPGALIFKGGEGKGYEPMVRRRGRRVVQVDLQCPDCKMVLTRADALKAIKQLAKENEETEDFEEDALSCPKCGQESLLVPYLLPLQKGDILIEITDSYRVYRAVEKAAPKKLEKASSAG
jgi:hypothetical protein